MVPFRDGYSSRPLRSLDSRPSSKSCSLGSNVWLNARLNTTALADGLERQRHEVAPVCKDDRLVERLRRHLVGPSGPRSSRAASNGLRLNICRTREGEDGSPLPTGDLRHDMGCGAEAIEPQSPARAGDCE